MANIATARRLLLTSDPFGLRREAGWNREGVWPANWISHPKIKQGPIVIEYSLKVDFTDKAILNLHVTGDDRYELYLDGELVGRGPERGDEDHWAFETYQANFEAGTHTISALVWSAGETKAYAQHSICHGFLLATEDPSFIERINTGKADWQAVIRPEFEFKPPQAAWGTGDRIRFRASMRDRAEWQKAESIHPGLMNVAESEFDRIHLLRPATLPAMYEDKWSKTTVRHAREVPAGPTHPVPVRQAESSAAWTEKFSQLLAGTSMQVPPNTRVRAILDLNDYVCARHWIGWNGKGSVRLNWQEALFVKDEAMSKGNRDDIEGKHFSTIWSWEDGIGDEVIAEFVGQFRSLWWHAGRYVEVVIETDAEPLTLTGLGFIETHYPYEFISTFKSSDPDLADIHRIGIRTLEMCSHETYMDCPYYEQLQYAGDTRLQVLATYTLGQDSRLPQQALRAFDESRRNRGITHSRYPSRVRQVIPPFSLWWICMLHDAMLYGDNFADVKKHLPGARIVLDYFAQFVNGDGLLTPPPGWNYIDWVPSWRNGMPPTSAENPTAPLNLQYLLALKAMAELEAQAGEPLLETRLGVKTERLSTAIRKSFWDSKLGILSDDLGHQHRSEHSQALGLIAGVLTQDEASNALKQPGLEKTTIYFTHYLFEAFYALGDGDAILNRLDLWRGLVKNGLKTTIEMPEPTRSDCHAWGAHPIYHTYASLLGIRPTDANFSRVQINPALSSLKELSGTLVTPRGNIIASINGKVLDVSLPDGLPATIIFGKRTINVMGGNHRLERD